MKVYIASDHAGFELKRVLRQSIRETGYDVEDLGPSALNEDDDFPDYVFPLARKVSAEEGSLGIVLGASGQGEAMVANRVKGIRAAVYYGEPTGSQTDAAGNILNLVQSVRAHNNANILALGARFLSENDAKHAVNLFLGTSFMYDARHVRRITKIDA
jgi:ribose 5-phosphate isomerase B